MQNAAIAEIFERIADLMELTGEQVFRINSYRKAARVLADLHEPVDDVAAQGRLTDVAGIGKSMAEKIQQYLGTGKMQRYEELVQKVPPELPGLLNVPGLGPKTVAKLWKQCDIKSLPELKTALEHSPDSILAVAGMGEKKLHQIVENLQFVQTPSGRVNLGPAWELAQGLLKTVRDAAGKGGQADICGSLRRGKETIGDIDLLCSAEARHAPAVMDAFCGAPGVESVLAKGATKSSVRLTGGTQADLRVVEASSYGAALCYFTGSKEHNVRLRERAIKQGCKLNEYGLFEGEHQLAGADEAQVYEALGLEFVPPELREDRGELDAAQARKLPKLIEQSDMLGDLHMHTVASDGHNTIAEMAQAALARGYRYICISDHSKSQVQANGLHEDRLADHVAEIHKVAGEMEGIEILAGCEVDIFKDGRLDFDPDVLKMLDFVVASPHTALRQGRDEATERFIRAIEHPMVNAIGHPSGRIVNGRPGIDLDIEKIADAAAANGVALEINAHWARLDLRDTHVRAAIDRGAKIIINTDAHCIEELDMMRYGVMTARRGWASAADVSNTWSWSKIKKFIAAKR